MSFKHHEDSSGGGRREDMEEDEEERGGGGRDRADPEDDPEDEPTPMGDDSGSRPVSCGTGGGGSSSSAARRRKPLAPQWVNPDWTESGDAAAAAAALPPAAEGGGVQRLNRSWEDRTEDKEDSRTINGVCVMMNPAAFGGQPPAEVGGRVWAAHGSMED